MMMPSEETIARVKAEYLPGDRVELVWMDDPQAPNIGELGTVTGVDDIGTIHVQWDGGSSLGVALLEDSCRKLPICPKCGQAYTRHPAISRRDNKTEICPYCGTLEALEDFTRANVERTINE